jgi:hypothetical protein
MLELSPCRAAVWVLVVAGEAKISYVRDPFGDGRISNGWLRSLSCSPLWLDAITLRCTRL